MNLNLMSQSNEYYDLTEALANKEGAKSLYLNYNFIEIKPISNSIGELNNLTEFRIIPRYFDFPIIEDKKMVSPTIDDSEDKSPHRIPDGLLKCRKLKLLDISNTQISSLPDNLEQLENLEVIILNSTPIDFETEISKILRLKKLKEIRLRGIKVGTSILEQLNKIEGLKILASSKDFDEIKEETVDIQMFNTYIVFGNEEQADRFIRSMPYDMGKFVKKFKSGIRQKFNLFLQRRL